MARNRHFDQVQPRARRRLAFECLEDRRLFAACSFPGPVLAALTTCRHWATYAPSQRDDGYDPTRGNEATSSHIRQDLQQLYQEGHRGIVTYTLDGNLAQVPRIAKEIGFEHVIAGLFWFDNDQLFREKTAVVEQWPYYDALVVGNEGLLDGRYTVDQLATEVTSLRQLTGKPVGTSETGAQYRQTAGLLAVGDFALTNIQPWFNGANNPFDPASMASAVAGEYRQILEADPNSLVVIKEAWWPTAGHAAATEANQVAFFQALVDAGIRFIWGEAFDQPWKTGEESPFGVFGPNWGLHTSDGAGKPIVAALADEIGQSYQPLDQFISGAMTVVRRMHSAAVTGGLPINEADAATLDVLKTGVLNTTQNFFNPAQLGFWFTTAVGAHAARAQDASFSAGYSDTELLAELEATTDKLAAIMNQPNNVYSDPITGGQALYQLYQTPTGQHINDATGNTVPLIDNAYLVAGLTVARQYLRQLNPQALDPAVTAEQLASLTAKLAGLLDQFDLSMWWHNGALFIGGVGTGQPRSGPIFDRITTETRLAPVLANSRGELGDAQLAELLKAAAGNTLIGASSGGAQVEKVGTTGAALETGVAAIFLPHELTTLYGVGTLLRYPRAWAATAETLGLPAYGPLAVAVSGNAFLRIGLSPAESSAAPVNAKVVSPLGAAIIAASIAAPGYGPLQRTTVEAWDNFTAAVQAALDAGVLHVDYRTPNAVDADSGLVGSPPLWGFLEVTQSLTAALNARLGGSFYFDLLGRDPSFQQAAFRYEQVLNRGEFEFDRDDTTPGNLACRTAASGGTLPGVYAFACLEGAAWHIAEIGGTLTRDFYVRDRGQFQAVVAYSNENADGVPGDVIELLVDGNATAQFTTDDTNNWELFVPSPVLALGELTPGRHQIAFRLAATDGFGVDLDWFAIEMTAAAWQNPVTARDINADGFITPLDVLLVINYINSHLGEHELPALPTLPAPYYDTDGNGLVTALDVLLIVNFLNAWANSGAGESRAWWSTESEESFARIAADISLASRT